VAPSIEVHHLLVEKASVEVAVLLDGERTVVPIAAGARDLEVGTPELPDGGADGAAGRSGTTVVLRRLAYARSGDKGDNANIGVIARRPEFVDVIAEQVTAERVARYFSHYVTGDVHRWALPGLSALNFVLEGALGGKGGTSTLRYDPQGKSFAAMLLELPVVVPANWDDEGLTALPRTGAAA
jgi:hypothetical protein